MKKYIKPTIDIVELRPEERLAACEYKKMETGINQAFPCSITGATRISG